MIPIRTLPRLFLIPKGNSLMNKQHKVNKRLVFPYVTFPSSYFLSNFIKRFNAKYEVGFLRDPDNTFGRINLESPIVRYGVATHCTSPASAHIVQTKSCYWNTKQSHMLIQSSLSQKPVKWLLLSRRAHLAKSHPSLWTTKTSQNQELRLAFKEAILRNALH